MDRLGRDARHPAGKAVAEDRAETSVPAPIFGPRGRRVYDLGSPSDAFWDVARAADGRIAVVGLRGSAAGGNDDAAVLLLPAP